MDREPSHARSRPRVDSQSSPSVPEERQIQQNGVGSAREVLDDLSLSLSLCLPSTNTVCIEEVLDDRIGGPDVKASGHSLNISGTEKVEKL